MRLTKQAMMMHMGMDRSAKPRNSANSVSKKDIFGRLTCSRVGWLVFMWTAAQRVSKVGVL